MTLLYVAGGVWLIAAVLLAWGLSRWFRWLRGS